MLKTFAALATAALVVAFTAAYAINAVRDHLSSDPDPIEALQEKRVAGQIDEQEFEQRLEFVLDDRNEQIRAAVETVPGISESRSRAIAREYDSLDELRASDRARLEDVPGIGEELAAAVLERVRDE